MHLNTHDKGDQIPLFRYSGVGETTAGFGDNGCVVNVGKCTHTTKGIKSSCSVALVWMKLLRVLVRVRAAEWLV